MNDEQMKSFLLDSRKKMKLLFSSIIDPSKFTDSEKIEIAKYLSTCMSLFTLFSLDVLEIISKMAKMPVEILFDNYVMNLIQQIRKDAH